MDQATSICEEIATLRCASFAMTRRSKSEVGQDLSLGALALGFIDHGLAGALDLLGVEVDCQAVLADVVGAVINFDGRQESSN